MVSKTIAYTVSPQEHCFLLIPQAQLLRGVYYLTERIFRRHTSLVLLHKDSSGSTQSFCVEVLSLIDNL